MNRRTKETLGAKRNQREIGQICSQNWIILANVLPVDASHNSLDVFGRPQLKIIFNPSFEQKNFLVFAPVGPTIEFEIRKHRRKVPWICKSFTLSAIQNWKIYGKRLIFIQRTRTWETAMLVNKAFGFFFVRLHHYFKLVTKDSLMTTMFQKTSLETELSGNEEAKRCGWYVKAATMKRFRYFHISKLQW